MAEEEIKKVKKPRQSKKAAAGTQRTEEKTDVAVEKAAVETTEKPKRKTVRKSVKTAQKEVVAESAQSNSVEETAVPLETVAPAETAVPVEEAKAEKAEKTTKAKKSNVKKSAKEKTEKAPEEKSVEEKPKAKKTAAKKKAEAPKKEEPKKETAKAEVKTEESEPAKQEEKQPTEAETVKTEEKPEVKAEKKPETKTETKSEETRPVTRAEKQAERMAKFKPLVLEVLQGGACKRSALVQQAAEKYQQVYGSAEYGNEAGVKGMVGNVLDQMIADKEAFVDGKTVSLQKQQEEGKPQAEQKTQKVPTVSALNEVKEEIKDVEKSKKSAEKKDEKTAENVSMETPLKTEKTPEKKAEEGKETALTKVEAAAPAPVYDLSALFEKKKPAPKKTEQRNAEPQKAVEEIKQEKTEELQPEKRKTVREFRDSIPALLDDALQRAKEKLALEKTKAKEESSVSAPKADEKGQAKAQPQEKAQVKAQTQLKTEPIKPQQQAQATSRKEIPTRRPARQAKVDPLKEAFLKKLRSLGGNYFEYYAIYLLERYSRMNGRRLEGLRISGGEYDGGIDGELELTDRLGFRETIYVQAKNWEPTDERWWIGETILQQFIGAVAYRQAKEGKQHCRGMFITTSAFTNGAKEMLDKMSDKFVGYDGDDLYETAKECQFGMLLDEKGNWKIDEELLSGNKSFFFML